MSVFVQTLRCGSKLLAECHLDILNACLGFSSDPCSSGAYRYNRLVQLFQPFIILSDNCIRATDAQQMQIVSNFNLSFIFDQCQSALPKQKILKLSVSGKLGMRLGCAQNNVVWNWCAHYVLRICGMCCGYAQLWQNG